MLYTYSYRCCVYAVYYILLYIYSYYNKDSSLLHNIIMMCHLCQKIEYCNNGSGSLLAVHCMLKCLGFGMESSNSIKVCKQSTTSESHTHYSNINFSTKSMPYIIYVITTTRGVVYCYYGTIYICSSMYI